MGRGSLEIQAVSHALVALQLRALLGRLDAADARMDVYVMMYFRLVDIHNEKAMHSTFTSSVHGSDRHILYHSCFSSKRGRSE